jgi:hypothetical protein
MQKRKAKGVEVDVPDARVLKAAWRKHTLRRVKERYDIELHPADYYDMQGKIALRDAMYLQKLRGHRTEWLVLCESIDRVIRVIYSEFHQRIVTALPAPNVHPRILRNMYKQHRKGRRRHTVWKWAEDRWDAL